MKYLLVLTVVLVALWVWRHNRQIEDQPASRHNTPRRPVKPAEMVVCAQCGLHLPASDALRGTHGWYCSPEHQRLNES